jgi:crotonobetaine/carnitine-CoA ligase
MDRSFGERFGRQDVDLAQQTVPHLLRLQAERWGGRVAVRTGDLELSFAELPDLVGRRAAALAAAGIGPGDRVAALCSNRIELLELILACGWLGAIAAPLNTATRGPQLAHMLANAEPVAILVEDEFTAALDSLDSGVPAGIALWHLDADSSGWPPPPADPAPPGRVGPGDTLVMLYTSGTTGPAKGVRCPHAQLFRFGLNVVNLLEITEDDVLYTCLPLFHTNALNCFFQALLSGATYALDTRFSASRFFTRAIDAGATVTYLLGAMVPILLKQPVRPQEREHSIRIANGNAPAPEVDRETRERFGFWVAECYASTEAGCVLGAPLAEQRLGAMGRPMPGYEAIVADDLDRAVPTGTSGELLVRAQHPFSLATGYNRMPEKTVEAWRNLWYHTGDRVVEEEDGYLSFVDRMTDSLRRRGENISSFEVEQVLLTHPDVSECAVFGVPSELGEDEVMAAVVLRPGATLEPAALVEFCAGRLAYFAIPRYLELVDALPLTENGKVKKFVLRERGVGPATWDREKAGIELRKPSR